MSNSANQFFFANSLTNYAEGGAYTNVPYWLARMAAAAGHSYAVEGGYGFLRNFAERNEPLRQWGFEGVDSIYSSEGASFASERLTSIVIGPANFIQWQSPTAYYWDQPVSPVDVTAQLVDQIAPQQPGTPILIYQGWADMAGFGFPPNAQQFADYQAYNRGAYTDWFEDYVTEVNARTSNADVQLLPVANILATLLTTTLSDIPVSDLYVDDAPHGTETIYFLAAMITYSATYGEAPPASYTPPALVHPLVAQNMATLSAQINAAVQSALDGVPLPPADPTPEPEPTPEPTPDPGPDLTPSDVYEARLVPVSPEFDGFGGIDFNRPDALVFDADLPFIDEGAGRVAAGAPTDNFAVRYSRTMDVDGDRLFHLGLYADDNAEIRIDGQRMLVAEGASGAYASTQVRLADGVHLVEVLYREATGAESLYTDIIDLSAPPPAAPNLGAAIDDFQFL